MPLFGKPRDELIHDPALHAHELILGLLRELREILPSDVDAVEILDRERGCNLQGGRRGEARPLGNVAVDGDVHPAQHVAQLEELRNDALGIVRPAVLLAVAEGGEGSPLSILVVHGKKTQVGVLAAGDGNAGGEIDGHGKHETVIVVSMLAYEIHATGSRGYDFWRLAILLEVVLLHWIH